MNDTTIQLKNKGGIYQIKNTINNKVYVGQSSKVLRRWSQHRRALIDGVHYNRYLQRALDKYGESAFTFDVLEYCDEEHLNDRERYWIEETKSEYSCKGYNAAYAYTLFQEYDNNKKINKSKRVPRRNKPSTESIEKLKASLKAYHSVEANRLKDSIARSTVDVDTIVRIKNALKEDIEKSSLDIAKDHGVSVNTVRHIVQGASHSLINKEANHVIVNRDRFLHARINRKVLRLYREAYSYTEIAEETGIHHRNVIRRINQMATDHDDRCRLNTFNYLNKRKVRTVITLLNMGNNTVEVSAKLGVSRNYIAKCKSEKVLAEVNDVNQMRGVINPFRKVVIE